MPRASGDKVMPPSLHSPISGNWQFSSKPSLPTIFKLTKITIFSKAKQTNCSKLNHNCGKLQCSKLKLLVLNDYGRFCVFLHLKFYRQITRSKSQFFPEVYWTGNIRFWHYISFPDSFEECMKRSLCETQIYIYPAKKIFWRYKSIGGKRTFCDNFSSHCESQEDVIHSHICTGVT